MSTDETTTAEAPGLATVVPITAARSWRRRTGFAVPSFLIRCHDHEDARRLTLILAEKGITAAAAWRDVAVRYDGDPDTFQTFVMHVCVVATAEACADADEMLSLVEYGRYQDGTPGLIG